MDSNSPLDMPYGLRKGSPMDSTFGLPGPRQLLPSPVQLIPNLAARQYLQNPMRQVMDPMQQPLRDMGVPQRNILPFSPARIPQTKERPALSLEEITRLTQKVESTNNYTALNRQKKGNTASGAYQYTDETWNNYGGYPSAMLAPPEVQDRRFQEDIEARYKKFNGDPFRIIAAHYLPAYANRPETWRDPVDLGRRGKVAPVEQYIRKYVKGTPLEGQFDAYLAEYSNQS